MEDKEIKKKFRNFFFSNFNRFYPVKLLEDLGFKRRICKKCGRAFWSIEERELCDDCKKEYSFIGHKNGIQLEYKDYWNLFKKKFQSLGYKPLNRYPVLARWLPNIDFVFAGINIFQPYAVNGDVEPPAHKTIEPQFCLRFNDIDNVGITGRHYSGFIMIGQHVFNNSKTFVTKEEALSQLINFFIKDMKIKKEKLILHEDIWAGGGNFGPSIEIFSGGLELANSVFIQYEAKEDGFRELDTKVVDMGAGHERWAWYSHGTNTSYDVVFPKVLKYLYKNGKPKLEYMKYFSSFNFEEHMAPWEYVSKKVGISISELKKEVEYAAALYSIADHTRSLLVSVHDGAIPSNMGGGYNLRNLIRRIFYFIDRYNLDIDLMKVFEIQMKEFGSWYGLKEVPYLNEIVEIEKKKYYNMIEKGKQIIKKLDKLDEKTLLKLYDSNGITPELIKEVKPDFKVPMDFYAKVSELHKEKKKKKKKFDTKGIPKTKLMFYENDKKFNFKAKVIKVFDNWVVLDKTYFYPKGGGQDCDKGKMNDESVIEVIKQDGVVFHKVENQKFKVGEVVECKIDKKRRKILTIHHSAIHVLGIAIKRVLGNHAMQCGSEKTVEKARLDVTHYKNVSFEEIQKIEKIANEIIKKKVKVEKFFMRRDLAEEKYGMYIYSGGAVPGKILRIVKIDNLDVEACGGTHVDNTSEIKVIKIINVEKVKDGVVRFEIVAGDIGIKKIQEEEKILHELSKLWNVKYDDLPKTAKKFFNEWKEQRKMLKKITEDYSELKLKEVISKNERISIIELPTTLSHAISLVKSMNIKNALIVITNDSGVGVSNNEINIKKEMEKYFKKVEGNEKFARGFLRK